LETPGEQVMNASVPTHKIYEHMDVVCVKGGKLGVVDRVEDDRIKLTAKDSKDGQHHYIPLHLVDYVDTSVHLLKPGDEIMKDWEFE
jgi:hypothetical protein